MPTFTGLVKVIISGFFEIILNGSFGWNIHNLHQLKFGYTDNKIVEVNLIIGLEMMLQT